MNRDWVLYNLREAAEELARTISEIEASAEYDVGDYLVAHVGWSFPAPARVDQGTVRLIGEWATAHRGELESNWERAQLGEPLERIEPLD